MNRLFTISRNERNHRNIHFALKVFFTVAFLAAAAIFANAQTTRVPMPGSDGAFGDMQIDGDRVKIFASTDGGKAGKVRIKVDADGSWWKMLRVYDKNGNANFIEQQDARYINNKDVIEIDGKDLGAAFKLEFWKAKFFGVHTYIMSETFRKQDFEGRVVKFIWKEGLEGDDSDITPDMTAPIDETLKIDGKSVSIKSANGGKKGYATIKFQTDVSWWTAVKTFERSGAAKLIEKADGIYKPAGKTLQIPISSLPSEITLEFWTAKLFGVQTKMATKKLTRERFDGRIVTIHWGKPAAPINETVKIEGKNATIRSAENGTAGFVTIVFNTNKDWWTAVKFFDRKGAAKLIERENGKYKPGSRTLKIPISSFSTGITLEFWTAKLFGAHTKMAHRTINSERFDGRIVTITWNK